ncbi:uncharacterized protein C2orf47 homolog, mitochondrial [Notothenia coriiceps]|uniref:Uncharacterized protein C2orf47 homolog, mitochondrial n=1 Tax=Notothenia coriiceps TaxID=8208 RepID=A0A6I9NDD9_9TELE|nr:PREDICTED: uncharacterized protein C2orf47 homolog, mitochondrial-like [Notothenia coriiceps]
MQRISSLAACRELGGLAARSLGVCAWKKSLTCSERPVEHGQWAGVCVCPQRPFTGMLAAPVRRLSRRRFVFDGQSHRPFSSQGADWQQRSAAGHPGVSVVGNPDPITWIRCKFVMCLIYLQFDLDVDSEEFESGVKQALVHVSDMMSRGSYHTLVGIASNETIDHVKAMCKSLTDAQRQKLAIAMDDIIFMIPEDVSVVFDEDGKTYCFIVMRFWHMSTYEGPDDPESTKIFKVSSSEDGVPQKRIVTAVYEFKRELTKGAYPEWKVTTIWHWHWKLAE